jgi:hypothetical protein
MLKPGALAAALALMGINPAANAVCPLDGATPFNAGPVDPLNGFAAYVQDSKGLALQLCLTGDGSAAGAANPCFFDAPIPGLPFSEQVGFGPEAFWWLSEATLTLPTGDAILVMGAEAAWVNEVPVPGEQFPFTRLRIRVDVPQPGIYTITHPFGQLTYVLPIAGRRAINDSFDIEFTPNATNQGRVGPWLTWDTSLPAAPAGFVGDAQTPHAVTGSPCGTNFLRISATALDGLTPIDLNGAAAGTAAETDQFTVAGQRFTGLTVSPLSVDDATYKRAADGQIRVNVFATAPADASLAATPGGALNGDGSGRYFGSSLQPSVPATVSVTATHAGNANNTQVVVVKDIVTVTRAQAACSGSGSVRSCSLSIEANSSDLAVPPVLSAVGLGPAPLPLSAGALSVTGLAVAPAFVTVTSAAGGSDTEPVKVINQ